MARIAERLGAAAGPDPAERGRLEARLWECGECVLELVRGGYPADAADYGGCTLLHALCWAPTPAHAAVLAAVLAHLDAAGPAGAGWSAERVRALVEAADEGGLTCLHVAARGCGPSREAVATLLMPRTSAAFAAAFDPALPRRPPPAVGGYLQQRGPHNRIPPEERWGAATRRVAHGQWMERHGRRTADGEARTADGGWRSQCLGTSRVAYGRRTRAR
jgi:hypothetical protein